MGFALGFLKGVADGINTDAALEKQKELELAKVTAASNLKNKLAAEYSEQLRTKNPFSFDYDIAGQKMPIPFSFLESDASDASSKNNQSSLEIMKKSLTPLSEIYPNLFGKEGLVNRNEDRNVVEYMLETKQNKALNSLLTSYNFYGGPEAQKLRIAGEDGRIVTEPTARGLPGHVTYYGRGKGGAWWETKIAGILTGSSGTDYIYRNNDNVDEKGEKVGGIVAEPFSIVIPKVDRKTGEFISAFPEAEGDESYEYYQPEKAVEIVAKTFGLGDYRSGVEKIKQMKAVQPEIPVEGGVNSEKYLAGFVYLSEVFLNKEIGSGKKDLNTLTTQDKKDINKFFVSNPEFLTDKNIETTLELVGRFLPQDYKVIGTMKTTNISDPKEYAERYMGFKDLTSFTKMVTGAEKVLGTTGKIKGILESSNAPAIGGLNRLMLMLRGIADAPAQLASGIESFNDTKKPGFFDSAKNFVNNLVGNGKIQDTGDLKTLTGLNTSLSDEVTKHNQNLADAINSQAGTTFEEKEENFRLKAMAEGSLESKVYKKSEMAVLNYYSYILAFQMAAAVQGDGDARTISDKDVNLFMNAIGNAFFRSRGDYLSVINEIDTVMSKRKSIGLLYKEGNRRGVNGLMTAGLIENSLKNSVQEIVNNIDAIKSDGSVSSTEVRGDLINDEVTLDQIVSQSTTPAFDKKVLESEFEEVRGVKGNVGSVEKSDTTYKVIDYLDAINNEFKDVQMYSSSLPRGKIVELPYNNQVFKFSTDEVKFLTDTGFIENIQNIVTKLDNDMGPGASDVFLNYVRSGNLQQVNPRLLNIAIDFITATQGAR